MSVGNERKYLESISPKQRRSAAWIDDDRLPPRCGIITSSLSESANNMFEDARSCSWMYSVDTILGIMMERISKMTTSLKGKHGIVQRIKAVLEHPWDRCAAFGVLEVLAEESLFAITCQSTSAMENGGRYTIDIGKKTYECGQWQEHGKPCIDAMAFFRVHQKKSINYVLTEVVDRLHTFATIKQLLRQNVVPVCIDSTSPDLTTQPPVPSSTFHDSNKFDDPFLETHNLLVRSHHPKEYCRPASANDLFVYSCNLATRWKDVRLTSRVQSSRCDCFQERIGSVSYVVGKMFV
jgi:hypothetical protein